MRVVIAGVVAAMAMVLSLSGTNIAQDKKADPKFTIKQVMKTAMKGGLCKKVADGGASEEDQKQLVELFVALSQNMPPKGEADSWKDKTGALLTAAKANDGAALKKAANCMACHSEHKK